MATVTEVEIPVSEFALRQTLAELPNLAIQVERVAAHGSEYVMPYVWTTGSPDDFEELDDVLKRDASVKNAELLTELDGERLYKMDWVSEIRIAVQILLEAQGTVMSAEGRGECWRIRILFPDREALSETKMFCEQYGLTMEIKNIFELRESPGGRYGLTEDQYATLATAAREGYYSVPREISQTELAEKLGTSHQSLSELLRRGHDTLIKDTLFIRESETVDE